MHLSKFNIVKYNMSIRCDNNYILSKVKDNKKEKDSKIINELKKNPALISLSDTDLLEINKKTISLHQKYKTNNGAFLEKTIEDILKDNAIDYKTQVTIDKNGIIVGYNEKRKNCYHIADIIIGNVEIGKSIKDYKVVSCKTTCRERWTQDNWTFEFEPMLYILLTISNDYPSSIRFRESEKRKIITCCPKKDSKDDRLYKLNFENLVSELKI